MPLSADEPDSFCTPKPDEASFSFAVIADTHQSMHAPALAARLYDEQPHFILHAGDYNKTMGGLPAALSGRVAARADLLRPRQP